MLFYWILIAALLISIAAVLALWSMREYDSAAPDAAKTLMPPSEEQRQGLRAEGENGRKIRGTIVLPKRHKVVK